MAVKGRNWAFEVYPESLPSNYKEIIAETGLPMAFSPLHNMDTNPDGTLKKAHYHVICYYENPTTSDSVYNNVCKRLNGTIAIKLESMTGMYRYHIHLDNPEKYQYCDSDRTFFNGFDVNRVQAMTYTERNKCLRELQTIIRDKCITEYSDLLDMLLDSQLFQLWEVAKDNTILLCAYIGSKRYKEKGVR